MSNKGKISKHSKITFSEFLNRIPDKVSWKEAQEKLEIELNSNLDDNYLKGRIACLMVLAQNPPENNTGILERFILKQLTDGDEAPVEQKG